MIRYIKLIITLVVLLVLPLKLSAFTADRQRVMNSLLGKLAKASTLVDSIKIGYDITDLNLQSDVTTEEQRRPFVMLLSMLKRSGDLRGQCDIIRQLAVMKVSTPQQRDELMAYTRTLPNSAFRNETMAFIRMCIAEYAVSDAKRHRRQQIPEQAADADVLDLDNVNFKSRPLSKAQQDSIETKLMAQNEALKLFQGRADNYLIDDPSNESLYDLIARLYELCVDLREYMPGSMLKEYLEKLRVYIEMLPDNNLTIKSMYLYTSHLAFASLGEYDEMVDACRTYLNYLDTLEAHFRSEDRPLCDYCFFRFKGYATLLGCYKDLPQDEVNTCLAFMRSMPDALAEEKKHKTSFWAFYLMASKKYSEALPMIGALLEENNSDALNELLLKMFVDAAELTGNYDAEVKGLVKYNEFLRDRKDYLQGFSEIEVRMKNENSEQYLENMKLTEQNLILANNEKETNSLFVVSLTCALVLVLVVLSIIYVHARSKEKKLKVLNDELSKERDTLKDAHAKLLHAREQTNMMYQNKLNFFHDISYEIVEPTKAINDYLQLIVDSSPKEKREVLERMLGNIETNVNEIKDLVKHVVNTTETQLQNTDDADSSAAVAGVTE